MNAEAVAWWHKQMDLVLDIGVDGWYVRGQFSWIIAPRAYAHSRVAFTQEMRRHRSASSLCYGL
jgi:alpha-glucosidase (family GH31 glycosyl hydrolase)